MKVTIVQRFISDYRLEFYHQLHTNLHASGIELTVLAGAPWPHESFIDVLDALPFGKRCANLRMLGRSYWTKGVLPAFQDTDLIIFEQASAALHLYPLLLARPLVRGWQNVRRGGRARTPVKIAYWGHGASVNNNHPQPGRDAWKRYLSTRVDWWFAYTELSADLTAKNGFPRDCITVVQNAIDTEALRLERQRVTDDDRQNLARDLFGSDALAEPNGNGYTGVFCGRLVPLKWIPLLIESLTLIHQALPNFRMLIVGDGIDRSIVEAFCAANPWCVWVGAKHGINRVKYLALGDMWLHPGSMGLAILDAFALGIPMATTSNGIHSPEISYLRPQRNGLTAAPTPQDFASTVVSILKNPPLLQTMQANALEDSYNYSIQDMAQRFAQGISNCLSRKTA